MPELKDFASSVAIIVSSCDAFFDAWRPFVFFFRKHWSDCPFPIFLIVNRLRVRSNFLQPITVGPDRNWASNMQVALAQIAQPYVLYLQEDYFLNGSVNRGQLASDFAYAFDRDAASFCFYGRSTAGARFCAAKRSIRHCSPRLGRAHSPSSHLVEERHSAINASTRRIGVEYGSARQCTNA